jgi:hypothetical protein
MPTVGCSLRQRSERTHVVTLLVLLQLLQQQRFLSSLLTPQLKKARGLAVRFSTRAGGKYFSASTPVCVSQFEERVRFRLRAGGPGDFIGCSTMRRCERK